jgi:hypothetical protein
VDEVLAQGATGPTTAEKRLVTVKLFLADLADPSFNPQQHRLPFSVGISDTHGEEYSEAVGGKTRRRRGWSLMIFCARATQGLRIGKGMARCLSCSQNAHDRNVLVRCAQ